MCLSSPFTHFNPDGRLQLKLLAIGKRGRKSPSRRFSVSSWVLCFSSGDLSELLTRSKMNCSESHATGLSTLEEGKEEGRQKSGRATREQRGPTLRQKRRVCTVASTQLSQDIISLLKESKAQEGSSLWCQTLFSAPRTDSKRQQGSVRTGRMPGPGQNTMKSMGHCCWDSALVRYDQKGRRLGAGASLDVCPSTAGP